MYRILEVKKWLPDTFCMKTSPKRTEFSLVDLVMEEENITVWKN
jgi:hypothetical protein